MSRLLPPVVSALCVSAVLVLGLSSSTPLHISIRTGLGLTLVYFIPGLVWTYVFWPLAEQEKHRDLTSDESEKFFPFIHRFILAFLFSMVLTPLGLLVANRLKIPIVAATIYEVAVTIVVVGILATFLRHNQRGKLKS